MELLFVCCLSGACRARQDIGRQDNTRQDTVRHDASSARRYYHHDHDAVRLTLQPDRRACEPDPDPKPDPEPEPDPEPGRRRQTRARHSLIPSAGASGTTAAKSELEAAAAAASCASCSVQCSLVSSCTAATAPAPPRQRETTTVDAQRGPRGGICAPGLSSPHSFACDKWDVGGQWNACPVRCFWCCIARPVAAPSLAHNRPAAPAVQSSRLCNHLISRKQPVGSHSGLSIPLMHQRRPGWQVLDAAAPFA